MPDDHGADRPERGPCTLGFPGEGGRQVAEQPRPAETTTSYDHPVATGFGHHSQGVLGLPQISVSQHGNAHCPFEFCDPGPVGPAGICLLHGSGVQRDGGCSLLLGDDTCVKEGFMGLVDTDPGFDRDRDPEFVGGTHCGADDGA